MIHFTKENKYLGGWAFDGFTTLKTIIPLYERHPEVFEGEPYSDHDGYAAFEIKVSEDAIQILVDLKYSYIGDAEYDFFEAVAKAMRMALDRGYKMSVAI
ncbi:unnamed protein product [marine sediment metagenome]|uniref:Uncharacterized protein n=1 Tax=marine sediment metagenome TaxID=412755 RepID=X1JBJ4_9ZZZZ